MTGIPNPAPVRTVIWHGVEILAHDACLACEGTKVVKRGSLGIYPITTNVGCFDRAALAVEACEHCGATGIDPAHPSAIRSPPDRKTRADLCCFIRRGDGEQHGPHRKSRGGGGEHQAPVA